MFNGLCPDLQNVVCDFAYRASFEETARSLNLIIFIKELDLHPFVLSPFVYDYATADRSVFDRTENTCRSDRYQYWTNGRVRSPLEVFFVWFCREELFDVDRIARVLSELDWRTIRPLIKDLPHRSRSAFYSRITMDLAGVIRCSELFNEITLSNLKIHPSTETRFMVHRVNGVL